MGGQFKYTFSINFIFHLSIYRFLLTYVFIVIMQSYFFILFYDHFNRKLSFGFLVSCQKKKNEKENIF